MNVEPPCFFDTNVLIYALLSEGPRRALAEKLMELGGVVSTQVLNEMVAVGRGKLRLGWPTLQRALGIARLLCGPSLPVTDAVQQSALQLAERYGLHIYDANIVAAALGAGCETLYSEDLQDAQRFGALVIRTPFNERTA